MKYIWILICLIAFSTVAQQSTELKGTVTNQNGECIPFAKVTLYQGDTLFLARCATDMDGKYTFSEIKPGEYTIEVRSVGLKTTKMVKIIVAEGRVTYVNVKLLELKMTCCGFGVCNFGSIDKDREAGVMK
ncbi:MAG: carboxypeptidase regulatory-like domain-containing protein [Crocinitomicaceae bacterium]|nr:carboxypeptidase regulatory-like domain-containing protein [Crocinitomicaceae bacterium]